MANAKKCDSPICNDVNKMIHVDFGYSGDRGAVTAYSMLTGKIVKIREVNRNES